MRLGVVGETVGAAATVPGDVKSMQSDNGSEFKATFRGDLKYRGIPHLLSPSTSPTWNNGIENSNNMMRIQCINFGMDKAETIEDLNRKIQQVAHVYNHTPRDCPPLAPQWLNVPKEFHLTLHQFRNRHPVRTLQPAGLTYDPPTKRLPEFFPKVQNV